jgi:terminal uridylyltransferase
VLHRRFLSDLSTSLFSFVLPLLPTSEELTIKEECVLRAPLAEADTQSPHAHREAHQDDRAQCAPPQLREQLQLVWPAQLGHGPRRAHRRPRRRARLEPLRPDDRRPAGACASCHCPLDDR